MANVIETLSTEHTISLIVSSNTEVQVPEYVSSLLHLEKTAKSKNLYSPLPKIGNDLLGNHQSSIMQFLVQEQPDIIYWSHSYLPAAIPKIFGKFSDISVVEFANIEAKRFWSTAKSSSFRNKLKLALEALKALIWEPRVARNSALCVALSSQDKRYLEKIGAKVVSASNGIKHMPVKPVDSGYLLIFASMNYQPNIEATKNFVLNYWPTISESIPDLTLVLAGRQARMLPIEQSENLRIISDPESQDEIYQGAIATVIPTTTGGGSQLKITESLQRGRLCLLSKYSLDTAPAELQKFLSDFVYDNPEECLALVEQISEAAIRQNLESQIELVMSQMSWTETLSELLARLRLWPSRNFGN